MAKRTSKAVEALSELDDPGLSTREIERLGEFGLWPGLEGEPVKRLTPDLIERAREAEHLVSDFGSHAEAALVMSARGQFVVEPAKLRKALSSTLKSTGKVLSRSGRSGMVGAEDVAVRLANATRKGRLSRIWSDGAKRASVIHGDTEPSGWRLHRFYAATVLIAREGAVESQRSLRDALDTAGVSALATEIVPGHGTLVPELPLGEIEAVLRQMSITRMLSILRTADDEESSVASEDIAAFVQFSRVFASYAEVELGASEAFGFRLIAGLSERAAALAIPGMIVVRQMFPEGVREWREAMAEVTPIFAQWGTEYQANSPTRHPP